MSDIENAMRHLRDVITGCTDGLCGRLNQDNCAQFQGLSKSLSSADPVHLDAHSDLLRVRRFIVVVSPQFVGG
jgi:hypothetical protein